MQRHLTPEGRAEILKLWNDGLSAGRIGSMYDVSRNAIVGIVHRHSGDKRRKYIVDRQKVSEFNPVNIIKPVKPLPIVDQEIIPIGPLDESASKGCCQFLYGDPLIPGWRMCGHVVRNDKSSWCEVHWHHHVRNPNQPALRNYNTKQFRTRGGDYTTSSPTPRVIKEVLQQL